MEPQKLFRLSDLLPFTRTRIAEMCRTGKIDGAIRIGRAWCINEADWKAFIEKKTVRGIKN